MNGHFSKKRQIIELNGNFPHATFDCQMVLYVVNPWLSNLWVLQYSIFNHKMLVVVHLEFVMDRCQSNIHPMIESGQ